MILQYPQEYVAHILRCPPMQQAPVRFYSFRRSDSTTYAINASTEAIAEADQGPDTFRRYQKRRLRFTCGRAGGAGSSPPDVSDNVPYRTIDQVSPPLPAGECTVLHGFGGTLPYGFSCYLPSWRLRQSLTITTMLFSYTASDYELRD